MRALVASTALTALIACQSATDGIKPTPQEGDTSPSQTVEAQEGASRGGFNRTEALSLAATARDICGEHMPDGRATRDALAAAGLPRFAASDGFWYHTTSFSSMIVGIRSAPGAPTCAIVVRNMTASEAQSLIQPWLSRANATPVEDTARRNVQFWDGAFRGGPIRLGIHNDFNIPGYIRGRAIIAGAP